MKIIAHRGFSDKYPENTLLAFEKALAEDVDGIETDVRLSRDEQAFIFHDDSLKRLARVDMAPETLTLNELQNLTLTGGQKIPSLGDLLSVVDAKSMLILEIKYNPATYKKLCLIIEEHIHDKLEWVQVSCFDDCVLEEMHRINPDIKLHKLIDKASTLKEKELALKYDYIDCFDIDVKLAKTALENGLISKHKVIFWTVGKEDLSQEIAAGLYAVMSNDPQHAKEQYA